MSHGPAARPENPGPAPETETPAAAPRPARSERLLALDAMRGVAVILVMGRHVLNISPQLPAALRAILIPWKNFGWMGVDLFFVLSGFLVSGLLFHEYQRYGCIRPLWFLGRRGFKIYPGFYFLLAVSWFWLGASAPKRLFVYEGLFIQNYFPCFWNHTWSLAVEEHFYLGLTAVLWALSRFQPDGPFRRLPLMASLLMVFVLANRVVMFWMYPVGDLLLATHYRVDALLLGTLIAYGWSFHRAALQSWTRRHLRALSIVSFALLIPCFVLPVENNFLVNTIGLTANYFGFGGLVLAAVAGWNPSSWQLRLLRPWAAVGFHSYSIYLWHMAVYIEAMRYLPRRVGPAWAIGGYFVGTIAFGWLMARLVEQPFLWLRDRVLPSRTA